MQWCMIIQGGGGMVCGCVSRARACVFVCVWRTLTYRRGLLALGPREYAHEKRVCVGRMACVLSLSCFCLFCCVLFCAPPPPPTPHI